MKEISAKVLDYMLARKIDTKDPFGVIRKYFSVRLFDPSLDRLVRKLALILEDGNRVSQALSEIRSLKEGVDASIISSIHPYN